MTDKDENKKIVDKYVGGKRGADNTPSAKEQLDKIKDIQAARAKEEAIAEHTVEAGETLSHVALKYYNNAGQKYYMHIYEANKAVIGDNPNVIKEGQVLVIPKEPTE
jgi:nucleoid-associated protein YgaU